MIAKSVAAQQLSTRKGTGHETAKDRPAYRPTGARTPNTTRIDTALSQEDTRRTIASSVLADYAAEPTEPLDTIAKRYGTSASALRRWSTEDADIAATYTRARTVSAGGLEDAILALLATVTPENYNAVRLQVDTLKWLAAKRHPKEYGDKQLVERTGDTTVTVRVVRDGQPVDAQRLSASAALAIPDTTSDSD